MGLIELFADLYQQGFGESGIGGLGKVGLSVEGLDGGEPGLDRGHRVFEGKLSGRLFRTFLRTLFRTYSEFYSEPDTDWPKKRALQQLVFLRTYSELVEIACGIALSISGMKTGRCFIFEHFHTQVYSFGLIFKQTPDMINLRCLAMGTIFCCLAFGGFGQTDGWKPLKLDFATFYYPPSWRMLKDTHGDQTLIRLTPDSMQNLAMKMVEIFQAPLIGKTDFTWFKGHFSQVVMPSLGEDGKILATKEIVFHNHACIYADAVANGLPVKIYGLDGLFYVYILVLTQRRYSKVPDPALERDEMAILNSVTYKH